MRCLEFGLPGGVRVGDTYNIKSYSACASDAEFEEFKRSARISEPAPQFLLTDLDGNRVSRAHFRGRYLVLEFGSIT